MPGEAPFTGQLIHFREHERRECAGKTGGRTRRQNELRSLGNVLARAGRRIAAKADGEAVLAFLHHRRAVEPQVLEVAVEVGCRDEQV